MGSNIFETCTEVMEAGNVTEILEQCPVAQGFTGGVIGGVLVALGIFVILLFMAAFYVYFALAWYSVAKKLKHKKPWLAWIPIVNIALILQLGGFHWAWILLVLGFIPGWIILLVMVIIAKWRIFVKRKYPGWFSLAILIPEIGGLLNMIAIGFLAWGKKK
jgi:hypothetical protein